VGQGALAIECATDRADVIAAVAPLMHIPTFLAVTAEARSRALTGSCHADRELRDVPRRRLASRIARC
jgi:porphobilinogen deaminase